MNAYHILNVINSASVINLTNEAYKYITESIIGTLLEDIEIMFLSNAFGSRATGAALLATIMLSSFGNAATAQDQVAAAPSGQLAVTQPVGKHVILRVGPGFDPISADSVARTLEKKGCTAEVTKVRGFPGHVTVEVDQKSFKARSVGSAGNVAEDWCLNRT